MKRSDRTRVLGALGVGLAVGGVAFMLWKMRRRWSGQTEYPGAELESAVVDALRHDEHAGGSAIDVAAVAPGVIELSGSATDWMAARRAVEVTQGVPGVSTVVNRLDIEALENQLSRTRQRFASGDPSLTEPAWNTAGAGMGRRRQGNSGEPPQRDDAQKMRSKAVENVSE
jgi:hypothetical protein